MMPRRWTVLLMVLGFGAGATGCYSHTVLTPTDVPKLNGLRAGDTLFVAAGKRVRVTRGTTIVVDIQPGRTRVFEGGRPLRRALVAPYDVEAGAVVLASEASRVSYPLLGAKYGSKERTLTLETEDGPHALPYAATGTSDAEYARLVIRKPRFVKAIWIPTLVILGVAATAVAIGGIVAFCSDSPGGSCNLSR